MSVWVQPLDHITLRLADEGVPLRAIARATQLSSEIIRDQLYRAKDAGKLVELPRDDWPPGVARNERLPRPACVPLRNQPLHRLLAAAMRAFAISPVQASYLVTMVLHRDLRREDISKHHKNVDVQIWRLRKRIELFDIKIETLWSDGYRMTVVDQRRATELITAAL